MGKAFWDFHWYVFHGLIDFCSTWYFIIWLIGSTIMYFSARHMKILMPNYPIFRRKLHLIAGIFVVWGTILINIASFAQNKKFHASPHSILQFS